jgi:hypothetical protein
MYNKLMGGVDMADQLLTTYYPSVKSVWLWDVIQDTVGLFVNNNQEFRRLGGQTYNEQQRKVLLEMPMDSLVGLSRGPERKECTGVLIVYDCWKHLVVTSYPVLHDQPEEDDGWLSS